jgi:4-hydroxybenzoyl-CoA thioesterase
VSFRHTTEFTVEFGDCDPAQIVFYPNFFRWMDSAARHFFRAAGVPAWHEMERSDGIIGTPLVEVSARFMRPATYGDRIAVDTTVSEWRGKSFVLAHVVRRGDDVLMEGQETRIFARRHPDDARRIQAVDPPERIRQMLG